MADERRAAFTLIELLIVMAIIAVLIALAMPALKAARESANVAQCASNIKQIDLGVIMYADEWNKFFPTNEYGLSEYHLRVYANTIAFGDPNLNGGSPKNIVNSYVNLPQDAGVLGTEGYTLFKCPGDTGTSDIHAWLPTCHDNHDHPTNPWPPLSTMVDYEWTGRGTSYNWNAVLPRFPGSTVRYPDGYANLGPNCSQGLHHMKIGHVKVPSLQVVVLDYNGYSGSVENLGIGWTLWCDMDWFGHHHGPPPLHIKNISFVDGHVDLISMDAYPEHYVSAQYKFPFRDY